MMFGVLLAVSTLYLGDENAMRPEADPASSKTLAFAGATTDDLIAKIDTGLLKDVDAEAVELSIGANNTRTRPYVDETPLDTVLAVKDILIRLRARYPEAAITLNPIPYAESDSLADRLRNYEVNRACVELHGKKMSLRQPPWMYERPVQQKWKNTGTPTTPYIKKYWLDNEKDPRFKIKRAEQRANTSGTWDCVMLGDSVTHFWELVNGKPYFDAHLRPCARIFNLGFGGDGTHNTLWNVHSSGLIDNCKVKVFTLLIGNNNIGEKTTDDEIEEVARGCKVILDVIREKHPESKIVLFPLLPRGNTPGVLRALDAKYNARIKTYADGKTIVWAGELYDRFLATADKDGVIPKTVLCDGCHPGPEGYRIWGEILKNYLPNKTNQEE